MKSRFILLFLALSLFSLTACNNLIGYKYVCDISATYIIQPWNFSYTETLRLYQSKKEPLKYAVKDLDGYALKVIPNARFMNRDAIAEQCITNEYYKYTAGKYYFNLPFEDTEAEIRKAKESICIFAQYVTAYELSSKGVRPVGVVELYERGSELVLLLDYGSYERQLREMGPPSFYRKYDRDFFYATPIAVNNVVYDYRNRVYREFSYKAGPYLFNKLAFEDENAEYRKVVADSFRSWQRRHL